MGTRLKTASKYFYTDQKKVEVVTAYLALGKAPMVEAVTGVPRGTIRTWKMQPWWKELEADIRAEEDTELDSKLSKIVSTTLDTVVDRLENGDFILDSRSGTVKRVPVKMKDAHKVSVDLIDKRNLLRGKPTSRVEKVAVEDTMLKLAETFKEWAQLIKREEKTIEGEIVDAIYDERQEGLQEREREVRESPRASESTDGTEQSPPDGGSLLRPQDSLRRRPQDTHFQGRQDNNEQLASDLSSEESFLRP